MNRLEQNITELANIGGFTNIGEVVDFLKEFSTGGTGGPYVKKTAIRQDRTGTRKKALERGDKYYTNKFPCLKCGEFLRFTRSHGCVKCSKSAYVKKLPPKSPEWHLANIGGLSRYKSLTPCKCGYYIRIVQRDLCLNCTRIRHRISASKRFAAKLKRIPHWVDWDPICDIYTKAAEMTIKHRKQYHVDHIIPLQGDNVSGFHTAENLQILLGKDNIAKKNRFQPYYQTPDGVQTPVE